MILSRHPGKLGQRYYMASHNEVGKEGEELAVSWLSAQGYKIIHRNWRYSHYEIDIIALKNDTLHIIEVKCRNFSRFGHPEESVRKKKFKDLQRAADIFLTRNPGHRWMQYDILAITLHKDKEPEYFMLNDVYL